MICHTKQYIVMRFFRLLMVALMVISVASCKQKNATPDPLPTEPTTDTIDETPIVEPVVEPAAQPAPRHAAKQTRKPAAGKTYYVSSYDQKGPVWGHVTMTGDTGTGVIHDSEENTFSVACTRHGNELFAVDQNSRQYVFKLGE